MLMLKKWYAKVIFFILYSFASYCMMQLFLDANPFTIGVNGIARNMFLFMIYYGVLLCFFSQNAPCIIVWWNIDDPYWRDQLSRIAISWLWNHIYGFLRYFYGDDSGGAVYR